MSGHEGRAFLEAILASPDDDTPRLVYADWLEEHGDGARAEFIRVQIERARLPEWDARQVPLRVRERALISQHALKWLAEVPDLRGVEWGAFRRGFKAAARFVTFEVLGKHLSKCRAATPLESVSVRWPRHRENAEGLDPIPGLRELTITSRMVSPREVDRLADAPLLTTLRALNLASSSLGVDGFRRLLASPHLGALRALRAPYNSIGSGGVTALVEAASLASLEELDLSESGNYGRYGEDPTIDSSDVEILANWLGLARLRSLDLSGNDVGRDGLRALLRSPNAAGLRALGFQSNPVDGLVMEEFLGAVEGLRLDVLDLSRNLVRDYGVNHLAGSPCLRGLKVLKLAECELPAAAGRSLATAPFLDTLRQLNLDSNRLGPEGLGAILDRRPRELHTLEMGDNDLGVEGAARLAASPASDTLLELDLPWNGMGELGARALAESNHLRNLLILRLEGNRLTQSAIDALRNSPLGKRLAVLEAIPMSGGDDIPF